MKRITALVGLSAAVAIALIPTAEANVSSQGSSTQNTYTQDIDLTLGCSNTSTDIGLTWSIGNGTSNGRAVLVFANPSVRIDSETGEFVKYDNGGVNKIALGDGDLSLSDNSATLGAAKKQGNIGSGGNPFIYYNKGGEWQYLGRCVAPSSRTERIFTAPFTIGGDLTAEQHGSCVTSTRASQTQLGGKWKAANFSGSAQRTIIFSNKALTIPINSKNRIMAGDVEFASISSGDVFWVNGSNKGSTSTEQTDNFFSANGYKVVGNGRLSASISSSDLLGTMADKGIQGIGGNPRVYLGVVTAGKDETINKLNINSKIKAASWSEANYIGRCNQLGRHDKHLWAAPRGRP